MNTSPPPAAEIKRRLPLGIAAVLTLLLTAWAAMQGDDAVTPTQARKARSPVNAGSTSTANNTTVNTTVSNSVNTTANSTFKPVVTWPDAPLSAQRAPWPALGPLGTAAWSGSDAPKASAQPTVTAKTAVEKLKPEASTPQAPEFPYSLIGRIDDGTPQAMLSGATRSFGVRVNEVIDGQWRVDAVGPQSVSLTWLPGSIKKTVAFSSAVSAVSLGNFLAS